MSKALCAPLASIPDVAFLDRPLGYHPAAFACDLPVFACCVEEVSVMDRLELHCLKALKPLDPLRLS